MARQPNVLQWAAFGSKRSTIMLPVSGSELRRRLRWGDLYREAELYKAAVRVYTKPLFQWRKALSISTDGRTLYDLAGRGLREPGRHPPLAEPRRLGFVPPWP